MTQDILVSEDKNQSLELKHDGKIGSPLATFGRVVWYGTLSCEPTKKRGCIKEKYSKACF